MKVINLFILIISHKLLLSEAVSCHASESNGCLHGISFIRSAQSRPRVRTCVSSVYGLDYR